MPCVAAGCTGELGCATGAGEAGRAAGAAGAAPVPFEGAAGNTPANDGCTYAAYWKVLEPFEPFALVAAKMKLPACEKFSVRTAQLPAATLAYAAIGEVLGAPFAGNAVLPEKSSNVALPLPAVI
jgi:hypothetical protein